jgi:hypothetical protein
MTNAAVVHEHAAPDLHQGNFAAPHPVHPWRKGPLALLQRNRLCAAAAEPKELLIIPGASHVDLYDRMDKIPFDAIAAFFDRHLKEAA